MPKLLVIDKNRFQGIAEPLLVEFVRNYNVVLPYVLCVECLMSQKDDGSCPGRDPMNLLIRIDRVVKAGACIGYSSSKLFQKERQTLSPTDAVIDKEGTDQVRNSSLDIHIELVQQESQYCRSTFEPVIRCLSEIGRTYFQNLEKKSLCRNFRGEFEQNDLIGRFRKWLEVTRKMKDAILEHGFSDIARYIEMDWYTWQMVRLFWAWGIEWACRRVYSGPSIERRDISNDLFDIEYVAYLSRADGILTRDERLVKPLAKAAFPDKDVFSSLDEVPNEYICHWS